MTDQKELDDAISNFPEFEFIYSTMSRFSDFTWVMFTKDQWDHRTETFLTLATEVEIMSKAQAYV